MLMSERWTEREINIAPVAIPTKFAPYTHWVWARGTEVVPSEARPATAKKATAGQNNKEEMKPIVDSGASA